VAISFTGDEISHPAFTDRSAGSLHAEVNKLSGDYYGDNTIASYTSKVRKFIVFSQRHDLIDYDPGADRGVRGSARVNTPIDPVLLCFYLVWLTRNGITTFESAGGYITALAAWCKARGGIDPRLDATTGLTDARYFRFYRGLKRSMGVPKPIRFPVTLWHLAMLRAAAYRWLPRLQAANMIAATHLAFAGLLRISEFTSPADLNPLKHAQRRDVVFVPNMANPTHVLFTVKVSKTDQFRQSCVLTIARAADPDRCPVLALRALFTADVQPPSAPLFNFNPDRMPGRCAGASASRAKFTKLCSSLFAYAGINDMYLKPHSFRQGGATALLAAGAPSWVIRTMGRWRSDCWQIYAHHNGEEIASFSGAMFAGATTPIDYITAPPRRVMDY
jgi:hypothetical protein